MDIRFTSRPRMAGQLLNELIRLYKKPSEYGITSSIPPSEPNPSISRGASGIRLTRARLRAWSTPYHTSAAVAGKQPKSETPTPTASDGSATLCFSKSVRCGSTTRLSSPRATDHRIEGRHRLSPPPKSLSRRAYVAPPLDGLVTPNSGAAAPGRPS